MIFEPNDSVLLVVAHPDDDVLGFGATAHQLVQLGLRVQACILCGGVGARKHRPSDDDLRSDTLAATELLGMAPPMLGPFDNIRMNTADHLDLVQFVESGMRTAQANIIITTDPADLNDDHRQTSRAAQAAARLAQRGGPVPPLKMFAFMEIPSSTDWSFGGEGRAFTPNLFTTIQPASLEKKLAALALYRDVMRPFPHPRSIEVISALAHVRGAQAGSGLAEALHTPHLVTGTER